MVNGCAPINYDRKRQAISLTVSSGIIGFTDVRFSAVINSCLHSESFDFSKNFSKSLAVYFMNEFDKSNDHNGFWHLQCQRFFSILNVGNLDAIFILWFVIDTVNYTHLFLLPSS